MKRRELMSDETSRMLHHWAPLPKHHERGGGEGSKQWISRGYWKGVAAKVSEGTARAWLKKQTDRSATKAKHPAASV